MSGIRYRISAEDTILQVDDAWAWFAVENGVSNLGRLHVLGQPIWRFVSGSETRHLYTMLLRRVRAGGGSISLPFRCDAPGVRRFMQMDMKALPGDEVEFLTRLIRTETRAAVLARTKESSGEEPFLVICSWCKQVKLAETEWVEVEEALRRLSLFQRDEVPSLSHGACQACYSTVMAAIAADVASSASGDAALRD